MVDENDNGIEDELEIIGTSGLKQTHGYVHEEFLSKLKGKRATKFYKEMYDNDPVVGAIFFLIRNFLKQVQWRVEPVDDSAQAEEQAEFLREVMGDMEHSWKALIEEIISMLPYGWAYFEKVFKIRGGESEDPTRDSQYDDGKFGIRKIALRSQDSLDRWEFADNNKLLGMWQSDYYSNKRIVFIPIEKALLFRTSVHKDNPEGRSILRNAVRPYYFKKRTEEFEAIGTERDLAGYPVFEVPIDYMSRAASPAKKATLQYLKQVIRKIRRDEQEGAIIPAEIDCDGKPTGFKFRLMTSGGSRQIDTDKTIRRNDSRIAMTVLAEFILLGMEKTGSWSLHSSKTNVFATALNAVLQDIVDTLQKNLVKPLMKMNGFDLDLCPTLVTGDIETPPLEEIAMYVTQLSNAGIPFDDMPTQRALRDIAHLPEPPEEEDINLDDVELPELRTMPDVPAVTVNPQAMDRVIDVVSRYGREEIPRASALNLLILLGVGEEEAERLLPEANASA